MTSSISPERADWIEQQVAENPILRFFQYHPHLPPYLHPISERFNRHAWSLIEALPRTPERTTALRKLLEGQDAAVRCAVLGKWTHGHTPMISDASRGKEGAKGNTPQPLENPYHELPPPPAGHDHLSAAEESMLRAHYLGRVRQEAKTMALVIGITEPAALGWLIQRLNLALGPMVIDGDEL